jgi:peptidyl-prolyl cis-trans isomerase SurA
MPAILAFALGLWGWHASEWTLAAQSNASQKVSARGAPVKSEEPPPAASRGHQGIALVVNGEAITEYDVQQRTRLLTLGNKQVHESLQRLEKAESTKARFMALRDEVIRTSQGKPQEEVLAIWKERQKQLGMELRREATKAVLPRLREQAREELIEERLKLQEAKKFGIEVSDDDVKRILKVVADNNKLSPEQLVENLKRDGIDIATMGERFRAREAWVLFLRRRYGAQLSVTFRDVDRFLAEAAIEAGGDTIELQMRKITLMLSARSDELAKVKRMAEAEALQRRHKRCDAMGELAKSVPETKFEDMKYVKLGTFAEPTRSLVAGAKDGDVLPPLITSAGVELYAVCGRRTIVGSEEQRAKAQMQLQSEQLGKLARRHLRNLRQDAAVEDRSR